MLLARLVFQKHDRYSPCIFLFFLLSREKTENNIYTFKEVWGKYIEESNVAMMISKSHTLCVPAGIKYGCFHLESEARSEQHTHH